MKNLKKKSLLLATLLFFGVAMIAQTGNGNQGKNNNRGNCIQEKQAQKCSVLNLSSEQEEQINTLRFKHKKEALPIKNQLNEERAKLRTLETAENVDIKAINSLLDEMGKNKTSLMKLKAEHKQEVRKLLTEEQRLQFDTMKRHKGNKQGKGNGYNQGQQRGH